MKKKRGWDNYFRWFKIPCLGKEVGAWGGKARGQEEGGPEEVYPSSRFRVKGRALMFEEGLAAWSPMSPPPTSLHLGVKVSLSLGALVRALYHQQPLPRRHDLVGCG